MATRAELKGRAKEGLRNYYWMAFLACLITGILGGSAFQKGSSASNYVRNKGAASGRGTGLLPNFNGVSPELILSLTAILGTVILMMWVAALLWSTFVGNVVRVGCCRYFVESQERQQSAGIDRLFSCFKRGSYLNVVMVMFMKGLLEFLWSLLLIIPGIIKSYEYYLVPYLLADKPDLDYRDALRTSTEMMDGNKWRVFVLELSFLGWDLLGLLLCAVGGMFVAPYKSATYAEFYLDLCRQASDWSGGEQGNGYGAETYEADGYWQQGPGQNL